MNPAPPVLKLSSSELLQHPELKRLLADCNFLPSGTQVSCAVSGGADSSAMLILALAAGCRPKAIYVDHKLRPESTADGEYVAGLAAALGLDFELLTAEVEPGPNLEERARTIRYSVLPADVLVGHTADDQAETVIINLLRGAGIAGLAGMRRDFRRPILGLRRNQTQQVCDLAGYVPVQDSMNQDMAFLRNRVRQEVLPLLSEISTRDIVPLLCRTADICRDADTLLDSINPEIDALDTKSLMQLSEAEMRWAVRRWVTSEVGQPPDLASVQRIIDVVSGKCVGTNIVGGHQIRRSKGRLSLVKRTASQQSSNQA